MLDSVNNTFNSLREFYELYVTGLVMLQNWATQLQSFIYNIVPNARSLMEFFILVYFLIGELCFMLSETS